MKKNKDKKTQGAEPEKKTVAAGAPGAKTPATPGKAPGESAKDDNKDPKKNAAGKLKATKGADPKKDAKGGPLTIDVKKGVKDLKGKALTGTQADLPNTADKDKKKRKPDLRSIEDQAAKLTKLQITRHESTGRPFVTFTVSGTMGPEDVLLLTSVVDTNVFISVRQQQAEFDGLKD